MKNRTLNYPSLNTDIGTLLLRLIFGGMFIYFGYGKLSNYDTMLGMMGDPIGIGSKLSLILVIFGEFFCGIFIAIGFLTRIFVIPTFITMVVAYFVVHANDPFMVKQSAFVYMMLCLSVFVLGSGKFSLDRLIFKRKI